jgi:hypothetical protein
MTNDPQERPYEGPERRRAQPARPPVPERRAAKVAPAAEPSPEDTAEADWDEVMEESFPASDPPSGSVSIGPPRRRG